MARKKMKYTVYDILNRTEEQLFVLEKNKISKIIRDAILALKKEEELSIALSKKGEEFIRIVIKG